MYNISIVREKGIIKRFDLYRIIIEDKTVSLTFKIDGYFYQQVKPYTIEMSLDEYFPIGDLFENIDFSKVSKECKECKDIENNDEWILECSISNKDTNHSIKLWCPSEDPSTPETTKLLQACNKICSLFDEDLYPSF